jgi:hypothetical protein
MCRRLKDNTLIKTGFDASRQKNQIHMTLTIVKNGHLTLDSKEHTHPLLLR